MTRLSDRQIKNRLDKIADLTNEIHAELKARYGEGFVYFEADGKAHANDERPWRLQRSSRYSRVEQVFQF